MGVRTVKKEPLFGYNIFVYTLRPLYIQYTLWYSLWFIRQLLLNSRVKPLDLGGGAAEHVTSFGFSSDAADPTCRPCTEADPTQTHTMLGAPGCEGSSC